MLKRALIYGTLIALAGMALTYAIGAAGLAEDPQTSQTVSWIGILFPIIGIVLAIRAAKRAEAGEFSFGDGFKQGALVTLVSAVVGGILAYLYFNANPDLLATMREAASAQLREQGLSGRELEQAQSLQAGMSTPGALSGLSFIVSLVIGLIISAVAAAIMRRKVHASGDGYGG